MRREVKCLFKRAMFGTFVFELYLTLPHFIKFNNRAILKLEKTSKSAALRNINFETRENYRMREKLPQEAIIVLSQLGAMLYAFITVFPVFGHVSIYFRLFLEIFVCLKRHFFNFSAPE